MVTAFESSFPRSSAWHPPRFRFETRILFDMGHGMSCRKRGDGFLPSSSPPVLRSSLGPSLICPSCYTPSPPYPTPSGVLLFVVFVFERFPASKSHGDASKRDTPTSKGGDDHIDPTDSPHNKIRPFNDRPLLVVPFKRLEWSSHLSAKDGSGPRPIGRPCGFPSNNDNRAGVITTRVVTNASRTRKVKTEFRQLRSALAGGFVRNRLARRRKVHNPRCPNARSLLFHHQQDTTCLESPVSTGDKRSRIASVSVSSSSSSTTTTTTSFGLGWSVAVSLFVARLVCDRRN
jgi:hypothetical protein